MHYTSIENIHKVIDPLFLDELKGELDAIKDEPIEKKRVQRARDYQDKLASLKFLDPACGSGNFLTETYLSLRRLENEVMPIIGDLFNPIKVDIHQFYGIEINDFAVSTATTALWIAEAQMMAETEKRMHVNLDFLPLKSYHNIIEGNALKMDWGLPENVRQRLHFDYIIGNPPFVGARNMSNEQKEDLLEVFGKNWRNVGNLDYVCCWYKKAAEYMKLDGCEVRTAFVSTNSVSQGEQVADLWRPLFEKNDVNIDFAWRTFRWDSESNLKAHVHCVIIGFSCKSEGKAKHIYSSGKTPVTATQINAYLIDGPAVFIESRNRPLCDVPEIGIGNKPIDGGFYLFSEAEKQEFLALQPQAARYFRRWYGADEFINNKIRYCLWLGDCTPAELRAMPLCLERVRKVREYRLASPSPGTVRLADRPTRFHVENMPSTDYIVIPETSSESRRYVPIGFLGADILCSNAVRILPDATIYHFGILTSNVHMAWMRTVCGRLKSDYRYSKDIVYNNFPWPTPTDEQKARIEKTAQGILDARAKYPDCSLADLYDELTMPPELRKAHQENDRAVMEAYGFKWRTMTEPECVAELLKMYQILTKKHN